jgi:hypothetical protein
LETGASRALLPKFSTMGVGKSMPVASMNKEDLSGAIQEVLGNPSYRDTARRFQRTIAQTHGLDRTADVLERAFQSVGGDGLGGRQLVGQKEMA